MSPKRKKKKENANFGLKLNGRPLYVSPIPPLPPFTGYICSEGCGKMWSGNSDDIWYYKQFINKWLCTDCGKNFAVDNACVVCGLCFNSEEDSEEESDDTEWIGCDKCGRWVMTNCDGIIDIALYDDGNPNHLNYICPLCSDRMPDGPSCMYKRKLLHSKEVQRMYIILFLILGVQQRINQTKSKATIDETAKRLQNKLQLKGNELGVDTCIGDKANLLSDIFKEFCSDIDVIRGALNETQAQMVDSLKNNIEESNKEAEKSETKLNERIQNSLLKHYTNNYNEAENNFIKGVRKGKA